jgi:hypothetical protein
MGNLEEVLKKTNNIKQVTKFYNLFYNDLIEGEFIEYIETELSFATKALILTNLRLLECQTKSFGKAIEISSSFQISIINKIKVVKGVILDDYFVQLTGKDNFFYFKDYPNETSIRTQHIINASINKAIGNEIEDIIDINEVEEVDDNKKADEPTKKDTINTPFENENIIEKLKKLKYLFDENLISEQEYQSKKADYLLNI